MINISFAITVCNEDKELKRLLKQVEESVVSGDEVVIQVDQDNATKEVFDVVSNFQCCRDEKGKTTVTTTKVFSSLNKDFAAFKNNIKKNCTKDWVFFIDADEEVNKQQIDLIRQVIESNAHVDCLLVPRINFVDGLTPHHAQRWGWRVDNMNRINWPDYQYRLCANKPEIMWEGKVHEKLVGHKAMALLPSETEHFALKHVKSIAKQEKQNNFYDTI